MNEAILKIIICGLFAGPIIFLLMLDSLREKMNGSSKSKLPIEFSPLIITVAICLLTYLFQLDKSEIAKKIVSVICVTGFGLYFWGIPIVLINFGIIKMRNKAQLQKDKTINTAQSPKQTASAAPRKRNITNSTADISADTFPQKMSSDNQTNSGRHIEL